MKIRASIIIGLLAIIVALPLILRRQTSTVSPQSADDQLVILSPHNESIRHEFGEAFAKYWKKSTGRTLYVDWRTPGGTSEIRMVLDAGFEAAEDTGRQGIGVDLFFGGGSPDFSGQAKKGRFVPLDVFDEHPDWFGESGQIPETFTGERYYAADHTWVSTCMSQFGICYNPDVLKRMGLPVPTAWDDLGHPGYFGSLALADPTKSGSVARTFELLIQDQIQRELKKPGIDRQTALDAGWENGYGRLIKIKHQFGVETRYGHLSQIRVEVGQRVSRGDRIGDMGNSGRSTGTHLHYEVRLGGTAVNPMTFIKAAKNVF